MKILDKKLFIFAMISIIIFVSAGLRLQNLGYSDYQGDEIRAFFDPKEGESYFDFLFEQRKGPNQFLVTGLLRDVSVDFQNHFITRLPFSIAGILSVVLFFLITKNYFGTNIAIIGSLFFATNGFLIAFSRIVQYQAFVIFFGLLGILLLQLFQKSKSYLYLYLGGISFSISILFHYDGVFFLIPVIFVYLSNIVSYFGRINEIFKNEKSVKHHTLAFLLSSITLLSFYIPFIFNLSDSTLTYWRERITGEESQRKISSSFYLFTIYQPFISIWVYIVSVLLGITAIIHKLYKDLGNKGLMLSNNLNIFSLIVWISIPFILLEVFVKVPGTHIYTYLIPCIILMAYGINFLFERVNESIKFNFLKGLLSKVVFISLSFIFVFFSFQSYYIFVDYTNGEYPWESKEFYGYVFEKPEFNKFSLSIFGFPYNRGWRDIGIFMDEKNGFYQTNEKNTISNFYLKNNKRNKNIGYYIYVENPQSFLNQIDNSRVIDFLPYITPQFIYTNASGSKSTIYYIPQDATLPSSFTNEIR